MAQATNAHRCDMKLQKELRNVSDELLKDCVGQEIHAGDDGFIRGMHFHVVLFKGELVLEKWCKLSRIPLDEQTAKEYRITGKYIG